MYTKGYGGMAGLYCTRCGLNRSLIFLLIYKYSEYSSGMCSGITRGGVCAHWRASFTYIHKANLFAFNADKSVCQFDKEYIINTLFTSFKLVLAS